jgi:hypothetical protein
MDPVSLIVAALVAGVSTGVGEAATSAVKDAYAKLRSVLSARLGGDKDKVIEEHAADPEVYEKPAAKVIKESGAADDPKVLAAAQRLLELADPAGAAAGKYTVAAPGSTIGIIGDHGTVTYQAPPKPPGATL